MKKIILALIVFFCVSFKSHAWDDAIRIINPEIVTAKTTEIFRKQVGIKGDYKPSLALLPNGELLLTTFRSHILPDDKYLEEIVLFRSIDNGDSWSEGKVMKELLGREPYVTVLKDGTLLMTSHLSESDIRNTSNHVRQFIHRSTDSGRKWTTIEVDLGGGKNSNLNTSRNILMMDDGVLLFLVSVGADPFFYKEDFSSESDLEILCYSVKKDFGGKLASEKSCIDSLNSLLKVQTLYETLILKKGKRKFSTSIEELVKLSSEIRLKGKYLNLSEYEKSVLWKLNRLLLEETYPEITPKSPDCNELNYAMTSFDNGLSWSAPAKINIAGIPKAYKNPFFGEAFLYRTQNGILYAIARVDSRYFPITGYRALAPEKAFKYLDHYDRMIFIKSEDGVNWDIDSDFLSYGEMYPSVIRLFRNVVMLTYTIRGLNPPLGVRAIVGSEKKGELIFNRERDYIIIETKTPLNQDSGGGFGNTVWSHGKFITCYSFKDSSGEFISEVATFRLPLNYANY